MNAKKYSAVFSSTGVIVSSQTRSHPNCDPSLPLLENQSRTSRRLHQSDDLGAWNSQDLPAVDFTVETGRLVAHVFNQNSRVSISSIRHVPVTVLSSSYPIDDECTNSSCVRSIRLPRMS